MALTLPIFPIDPFLPLEREEMDPEISSGTDTGAEQVRPLYSKPKMKWNMKLGPLTSAERTTLRTFLRTLRKNPFLFHDRQDCNVTGEAVGVGDGNTAAFYLAHKNIQNGDAGAPRALVYNNAAVYIAGVLQVPGVGYTLDQDQGIVTFPAGYIPAAGAAVTANYSWYYKVRNMSTTRKDQTDSVMVHSGDLILVEMWP